MATKLNAQQRLKLMGMAVTVCLSRKSAGDEDVSDLIVRTYIKFRDAVLQDTEAEDGWLDKLELLEAYYGSPSKAAEALGTNRIIFWKLKQMASPSQKYGRVVDKVYSKIMRQSKKEDQSEDSGSAAGIGIGGH